jgi:hypothetical protein
MWAVKQKEKILSQEIAALEQNKVVYVDFLNGCYRSREGRDVVESGCWMDKWWSKARLWQHKMNRCGEKLC